VHRERINQRGSRGLEEELAKRENRTFGRFQRVFNVKRFITRVYKLELAQDVRLAP